ncbi:MAG TPA: hypothetical protein VN327_08080 [Pseudonocardiaceae bacterium]|nr:hypothetical protein [Pseudonocardiaceae bacterium]
MIRKRLLLVLHSLAGAGTPPPVQTPLIKIQRVGVPSSTGSQEVDYWLAAIRKTPLAGMRSNYTPDEIWGILGNAAVALS